MSLWSSNTFFSIFFCFCLLHSSCHNYGVGAKFTLPANVTIAAVLVFGDSIVDAGNNNDKATIAKANYPPYGRDFMGGKVTGRFSNGKLPGDILVDELGVKELLPAYRDPNLRPEELLTGVTFASGGAGFDPLTAQIEVAESLEVQIQEFKEYMRKIEGMVGVEEAKRRLNNTLFIVVASSNDVANTYFNSRLRQAHYDIGTYTDMLAVWAGDFIKELYDLGATKFGVLGCPPVGCLPSTRTVAGGKERRCNEDYNEGAKLFNTKLIAKIDYLNANLLQATVVYVDCYNRLLDIINNPQSYGFEVADKGCCGTGNIEVTALCNVLDKFSCPDASKYVFWDSFHPTEKTYKILSTMIVNEDARGFFCGNSLC